ncbi:hypothetical protein BDW42DRAFT_201068 [Aspergillus taichungensis]|uniref:Uncharacterized protein n=1 Tax=Aspergillus taichungensis TaxID=482145 RepID=A0A2J5HTQ9_9EURO|nr:hypothetical protein BDW42DRAFT_201068 [Aspergillus taichungensis]
MNSPHDSSSSQSTQTRAEEQNHDPPADTLQIKEKQSFHETTPDHDLRRRMRALWLLLLYLPVLILPWILTCIMMFRPIMKPSYINQVGKYSVTDIYVMQRWNTATDILHNIASVLAVPIVSALLAYGAVIYTQRRKASQDLNIRQMFALADRGWTDGPTLLSAYRERNFSRYLCYGALLILLASIQPPLRQLLVQDETMTVITCNDQPVVIGNDDVTCDTRGVRTKVVGYDAEPQLLELCPQDIVIQRTRNKIIDVQPSDVQPHLWRRVPEDQNIPVGDQMMNSLQYYYSDASPSDKAEEKRRYFVSSLRNGTTTGVLREHAIRMDTDVECVIDNSFPEHCAGDRPFITNFSSPSLEVAICGEGSYDRPPWKNTRDRQKIKERLWMHMKTDVNAMNQPHTAVKPPPESSPFKLANTMDPFGTSDFMTPGPLLSAALALFGNGTLLHTAREATKDQQKQTAIHICHHSIIPFMLYYQISSLGEELLAKCLDVDSDNDDIEDALPELVGGFMQMLYSPQAAKQVLELTAFFANEALLMTTAEVSPMDTRNIYTSPGHTILKPQKSIPGLIVISCLIGLQVAGLLVLVKFIYSEPSWTVSLDARTLVSIGTQLRDQGRGLDDDSVSGVVGIGEREVLHRSRGAESPIRKRVKVLALGEPGNVSSSSA